MQKKVIIIMLSLFIVILLLFIGVLIGRHYYYKKEASQKLDEFISAYQFPTNKVTVNSIYQPMKQNFTYVREVHIYGDKENWYVFSYNRYTRKVNLTGVVNGGDWISVNDSLYKKLKYRPSKEFINKYKNQ
ncbi:MAG: hypothetical protein ABF651_12470 [Sporolactobacillus sp.]